MAVHNERPFEDAVCAHLTANGWLYSRDDAGYDVERALFPIDVFGWLTDSQPDEFARLADATPIGKDPYDFFLDSLVKRLDHYGRAEGGTLGVLRNDHRHTGRGQTLRFKMCQFAPPSNINPDLAAMRKKVRLRVMRQVHYSKHNRKSIDLVLFVNGLPVATIELKSDYTQSVEDAIEQYKADRQPGRGRLSEPLLVAGARALVHFAVSHDEVFMTTRLDGADTIFLPFNRGHNGAPGNPPNPAGHATSYLWEQVLEPSNWLAILGRFLHSEPLAEAENMSGEARPPAKLLFPRFHQWESVKAIVDDVKAHGTGRRFLIQHSAGSGKTNSIAWTAHGLSALHDASDRKVYSSVVVLTDRKVLDKQLQDTIKEIGGRDSSVTPISDEEARRRGFSSKSALLAKALNDNHPIVITTIQTFPHAMDQMDAQADKRFAVIIDEAHQSQDGDSGRTVDVAFARAEGYEWDPVLRVLVDKDGVEVTPEEFDGRVEEEARQRALGDNVTFVAFTATPKSSTVALFGTPDPSTGEKRPFHLYSMKQAIEEGFILDVLRFYRSVDARATLGESGGTGMTPFEERLVDGRRARREVLRRLYEDEDLIAHKARYIVEHFEDKISPLLGGAAKAMVVAYSRLAAVRYLRALERAAADQGADVSILVAFSGAVTEAGREETEASLNGRPGEPNVAFQDGDEFRLMVVANKYQTGFSERRLSAMYLDKPISGINAVQTLSRLNRTMPAEGKDRVFVVDFTQRGYEMLAAFQSYYLEAELPEDVDANQVHDLRAALDDVDLYTDADVDAVALAALMNDQAAMDALVGPIAREHRRRLGVAIANEDADDAALMTNFASNVSNFLTAYAFLSQITDFAEAGLEKRYIFLSLLAKRFKRDPSPRPDLSGLTIALSDLVEGDERNLGLTEGDGTLDPIKFPVSEGMPGETIEETLRKIIDEFNARIGEHVDVDEGVAVSWIRALVDLVLRDEALRSQAGQNDPDDFEDSPRLGVAVDEAVRTLGGDLDTLSGSFLDNDAVRAAVLAAVSKMAHTFATDPTAGRRRNE